jgi:hypothetical protein
MSGSLAKEKSCVVSFVTQSQRQIVERETCDEEIVLRYDTVGIAEVQVGLSYVGFTERSKVVVSFRVNDDADGAISLLQSMNNIWFSVVGKNIGSCNVFGGGSNGSIGDIGMYVMVVLIEIVVVKTVARGVIKNEADDLFVGGQLSL